MSKSTSFSVTRRQQNITVICARDVGSKTSWALPPFLSHLSYDFSLTFILREQPKGRSAQIRMRARNKGGKKRRAGKTPVRCSGLLHWDEFASAPWGPSTAAEQSSAQRERERREERGERREAGKTGIRCYCWFQQHGWGKNPEPESGFRTAPSPSASAEQMESYGENGWETGGEEQEHEAFFFLTLHRADSPALSVPSQPSSKDFILPVLALLL